MISASRYKKIADLINDAQDRGNDIVGYLTAMTTTLSNSEILEDSIDRQRLEDQINASLDFIVNHHQLYAGQMVNFVYILQKYIDDNYTTINDFLVDNNTQVKAVFANISRVVGYPIDASNIEDVS